MGQYQTQLQQQVQTPQKPQMYPYQTQSTKSHNESFDHQKPKVPPQGNILHVANIHPELNYEQIKQGLYNLFSIHGPIYDITIKTKENGSHFAFVDFPNLEDAEKALHASKKEGKVLQNKGLIVNYCEDPKKNEARKGAKCFLCLGVGHKAKNCPVKPQLIKPPKKNTKKENKYSNQLSFSIEESGFSTIQQINNGIADSDSASCLSVQSQSDSQQQKMCVHRDKDYLRFLKLKKKLIEDKLKKKIVKQKRRRL